MSWNKLDVLPICVTEWKVIAVDLFSETYVHKGSGIVQHKKIIAKKYAPLKRRSTSRRPHGAISHKAVIFTVLANYWHLYSLTSLDLYSIIKFKCIWWVDLSLLNGIPLGTASVYFCDEAAVLSQPSLSRLFIIIYKWHWTPTKATCQSFPFIKIQVVPRVQI
jgi:hypothetical protein